MRVVKESKKGLFEVVSIRDDSDQPTLLVLRNLAGGVVRELPIHNWREFETQKDALVKSAA